MNTTHLCLALAVGLAAGAVWAGDETNRWHGGAFDGWDYADAAGSRPLEHRPDDGFTTRRKPKDWYAQG